MSKRDFSGLGVALATPFSADGSVDVKAYRRIVRHVAQGGADVLVALGSTGEAATLEEHERDALIAACLEEAGPKAVVVGTGHNATRAAAKMTARAQALGAAGALVVTPYYNKPMKSGLVAHFQAVADAAPGLPIIAYNVPGRTGLNLTPPMLLAVLENPAVVAVKESSGNLAQIGEIGRILPEGKLLLAGDDNLALASIAVGAAGLVSVAGNLVPGPMKALVDSARKGDLQNARRVHRALLPLMDALFVESNPIPLKAGLKQLGLSGDALRLPLTEPEPETARRIKAALDALRRAGIDVPASAGAAAG